MKRTDKLFGVAGLFSTPDEIIKAANNTANAGYKKYDVHTPYPVHGMDRAMKLPPSKLGFVTLGFGLSGTVTALLLMWFTMGLDYPMIIGGKPFFALPAFIPVTFELTVLFATLATVIGMLTFFFGFPSNSHPLHDTPYMQAVSKDKYGVCIESDDPMFEIEKSKDFLRSLGAYDVQEIYYPEKEQWSSFDTRFLGILLVVALVTSGVTYFSLNKLLYMVPFSWMSEQERLDVQSTSSFFSDGFSMRKPVKGTVARGFLPYEYADSLKQPTVPVVNPFIADKKLLALGEKKYRTFCSPCHGNYGDGDSRLRGQFPNPPSLHSAKVREWADGNIYHVIMVGQNVMPSYANQLNSDEAWAVVSYIRALQKAKNADENDIKEFKKESAANVSK